METAKEFLPRRQPGIIFHLVTIFVLLVIVVLLFSQTLQVELGPAFLTYLLGTFAFSLPLPFLIYRFLALNRAVYILGRDGIQLRWGFRIEDIPMRDIEWVQLPEDLSTPLRVPRLRWPGSYLGERQNEGFGKVEFIAAEAEKIIIIGTKNKVLVISPEDRGEFLQIFQELTELGSLSPYAARSIYPGFLISELWESIPARILLVTGILLNFGLLIWVGLAIPVHPSISLGFTPDGSLLEPVPGTQLFLLPVISIFFFLGNFVMTLYFYRQKENIPLTYVLWSSNILTAVLFFGAVYVILQTG